MRPYHPDSEATMTEQTGPQGHRWITREGRYQVCAYCGMSKPFFYWMTKERKALVWWATPIKHGGPVPMPCQGGSNLD